jgi:hypothetical protein
MGASTEQNTLCKGRSVANNLGHSWLYLVSCDVNPDSPTHVEKSQRISDL